MKKEEEQTTSSEKKNSYVVMGRGWLIGILFLTVVLSASVGLWFALSSNSATTRQELTVDDPENKPSTASENTTSSSSDSTTDATSATEDRGLELARETKELASQGKVYGIPFRVDASYSEVERLWGRYDDFFRGTPYWSFVDKDVGFYSQSADMFTGYGCAIYLGYFKEKEGSLPPRYREMTFDHVKKVFGTKYRLEQVVSNAGTDPTEVYFYHLPPYAIEFLVSDEKIRLMRVGTERCGIFGSKVDFFNR